MKSVMIVYNQANNERVEYMLDTLGIRGFTFWENVQGCGHEKGDPHRGTHTWPELNNAILTVIPDDQVDELLLSVLVAVAFISWYIISLKYLAGT